jgi:hypothetical protein
LASKGSLVNFSLFRSGKWHAVGLELQNSLWGLSAHVVNGVLITEPVTPLYGVISVPSPVILVHIAERSVDTSLCGYSVRSGGEQLGNTGGFKTLLNQTEGSSEA